MIQIDKLFISTDERFSLSQIKGSCSEACESKDTALHLTVQRVLGAVDASHVLEVTNGNWIHFASEYKLIELVLESEFLTFLPVGISESEDDGASLFAGFNVVFQCFFGEVAFHVDARAHDAVVLGTEFLRELLDALSEPEFRTFLVVATVGGGLYEVLSCVDTVNIGETFRLK